MLPSVTRENSPEMGSKLRNWVVTYRTLSLLLLVSAVGISVFSAGFYVAKCNQGE